MIPSAPILQGAPRVGKGLIWGDRTLSDAVDTIHVHSFKLSYTVPMYAGAVKLHAVGNGDRDVLWTLSVCVGNISASTS